MTSKQLEEQKLDFQSRSPVLKDSKRVTEIHEKLTERKKLVMEHAKKNHEANFNQYRRGVAGGSGAPSESSGAPSESSDVSMASTNGLSVYSPAVNGAAPRSDPAIDSFPAAADRGQPDDTPSGVATTVVSQSAAVGGGTQDVPPATVIQERISSADAVTPDKGVGGLKDQSGLVAMLSGGRKLRTSASRDNILFHFACPTKIQTLP